MKVIIAGGRDFEAEGIDWDILEDLYGKFQIIEIVSGKASGADTFGEEFAKKYCIPIAEFPAKWDDMSPPCAVGRNTYGEYNKLAGFNRNEEMARYADAVILFSGGNGTNDMYKRALRHQLRIIDLR